MASDIGTLARSNFATILGQLDIDTPQYEIVRQTTTKNSMGSVKSISETTFDVNVIIQALTAKDRQIHESGNIVAGDKRAFFKYDYDGNDVQEDDILRHKTTNKEWRIIEITSEGTAKGVPTFKEAIIRSIHLEGS